MADKKQNKGGCFIATGRRKKSIARVRLYPGSGKIEVNGRNIDEYLQRDTLIIIAKQPLVRQEPYMFRERVQSLSTPEAYSVLMP